MRRVEGLLLECTRCKRMLPRGRFHLRAGSRVERRAHCRECVKPARAAVAARRRKRVVGRYTAQDVRDLGVRQGGRCAGCGRDLRVVGYHVDHVVPLARGGLNVVGNLQLLCPGCNLRKGDR